jgi:hypothetical protein
MRNPSPTAEVAARKMPKSFSVHRFGRGLRAPLAVAVAAWLALTPAGAETKLTEFNGQWLGSGTDRDTPLATAQPTQCQTRVTADLTHLTSDMTCNGNAGLNKRVKLSISFTGNKFTGTADQTSVVQGSGAAPKQRSGTVTGVRTGDKAEFEVNFGVLTPNAHVVMKLTSPTSYAMMISALGATLTKVDFRRPGAR